jgi:hypothetical protein
MLTKEKVKAEEARCSRGTSSQRRLGPTFMNGARNSPSEMDKAAKIAASASTVTPLSPRSSLRTIDGVHPGLAYHPIVGV